MRTDRMDEEIEYETGGKKCMRFFHRTMFDETNS